MITEWSIKKADGRGKIRISVIRSARKSLGLEVRDANTVLARIPTRVSDRELKAFVENHRSWILEKTAVMAEREENRKSTPAPLPELLSKTDWMKIQLKIGKRVRHYCETMGVTVGYVTVKSQKTRWGSCSLKTGTLAFARRLCVAPLPAQEYVVVHEFCHFAHPNHGPGFWAAVAAVMPDYKARERLLKQM